MKLTRYILAALTVWATVLPTVAQTDVDATITAVRKVIKNHERNALPFVESEILSKYKKNAEVLTAIAGACDDFDSTLTFSYIDKVFAVNANYVPAYIVKGKSYRRRGDYDQALLWFDKAIAANPNDSTGYLAYADVLVRQGDLDGAAQKMASQLQYNPTSNIYAEIGVMYTDYGGMDYVNEAISSFEKADVSRMTSGQVEKYVRLLHAAGSSGAGVGAYNRADSILDMALLKYPSNANLNRLMLKNSVTVKKYDKALDAADALFNKSDSLTIDLDDFLNYGSAYIGLRRYDDAIAMYHKCIDFEIKREDYKSDVLYDRAKKDEFKNKGKAMEKIVEAYNAMGYTDEAIAEYGKYIEYKKDAGILSSADLNNFAIQYSKQAEILNGEEKLSAYRKSFEIFGEMARLALTEDGMLDNAVIGYVQRVILAANILDRERKEQLAVPDAEEIVKLCPVDSELNRTQLSCLKTAVRYLILVYDDQKQYKRKGIYWKILGQLDPTEELYSVYNNPAARRKMGIR